VRKGYRSRYMMEILCTHVETIPGMGRRGEKENGGGNEFHYNAL
jgi:hypothetical protein